MQSLSPMASTILLLAFLIVEISISAWVGSRRRTAFAAFWVSWFIAVVASVFLGIIYVRIVDGSAAPPTPPGEMGATLLVITPVMFWGPLSGLTAGYVVFRRNRKQGDCTPCNRPR